MSTCLTLIVALRDLKVAERKYLGFHAEESTILRDRPCPTPHRHRRKVMRSAPIDSRHLVTTSKHGRGKLHIRQEGVP